MPVLSKQTVSIFEIFSNTSPFFISIPFLAANPSATTTASGVASPKEHGHAITSTVTKCIIALLKPNPNNKYTIKVIIAIPITVGTNILLILSAIFAIGNFELAAFILILLSQI